MGDAPMATHLALTSKMTPALRTVGDLTCASIASIPYDPFIQSIWLALRDRPPFDLRAHKAIYGRIVQRFHANQMHFLDDTFPKPPSELYADTLITYFRGCVTDAQRIAMREVATTLLHLLPPTFYLRFYSLANLLTTDEAGRNARWASLAKYAAGFLEHEQRNASLQSHGRCFDIPFYYLPKRSLADFADAIERLERYRTASLWYVFARQPAFHAGPNGEEEIRLLKQLATARFLSLRWSLPGYYHRIPASSGATDLPALLADTISRLDASAAAAQNEGQAYCVFRAHPVASLSDFSAALVASEGAPSVSAETLKKDFS